MSDDLDLLATQRRVFESSVDSSTKLVALALLDHWSRATETFPSIDRLADWTSLNRTTVMRGLAALEQLGAINVSRRNGSSNRYELGQLSLLPVASRDRSDSATGRAMPRQPVAPRDLTSRTTRPEGTQQGTQEGTQLVARAPDQQKTSRIRKSTRKRKRQREATLPHDWQPTEAHRMYAKKYNLQVELEIDSFRGWAEGRTQVCWDGTFSTRLANQVKWNRERGNGGGRKPVIVQTGGTIHESGGAF